MPRNTLLIVEHEPKTLRLIQEAVEEAGWSVKTATTTDAAIEEIEDDGISAVIVDAEVPGCLDGVSLSWMVRTRWPELLVVVLSERDSVDAPINTRVVRKTARYEDVVKATSAALR